MNTRTILAFSLAAPTVAVGALISFVSIDGAEAQTDFDTGFANSPCLSDCIDESDGPSPSDSDPRRIWLSETEYTLNTAVRYEIGDTIEVGPITWEYVGPMVFTVEPSGNFQTAQADMPEETAEKSTEYVLLNMMKWDLEGHRFQAVSVDMALVTALEDVYNSEHAADEDPTAPAMETTTPEPAVATGDSWVFLSDYLVWGHEYPQHISGEPMLTGRFLGVTWFDKLNLPGELQPDETDAVVVTNYCSGVLIDEDKILTARHCVVGFDNIATDRGRHTDEWCTRGNLSGSGASCMEATEFITHEVSGSSGWRPWKDWAIVHLEGPLISQGNQAAVTMALSQHKDQKSASFSPKLLGAPIHTGPMNDCHANGTDSYFDSNCDNLRHSKEDSNGSKGRHLYLRDHGEVLVETQFRQSVAYNTMFGSADSGGPIFWEGNIPGGERFVVSVVSAAWPDIGASLTTGDIYGMDGASLDIGVHLRGPRVYYWRTEMISQMAAF